MDPRVAKDRRVNLGEEGGKVNRKTASKCKGRGGGQGSKATGRAQNGRREVDREPHLVVWAPPEEPDKRQGSFERESKRSTERHQERVRLTAKKREVGQSQREAQENTKWRL